MDTDTGRIAEVNFEVLIYFCDFLKQPRLYSEKSLLRTILGSAYGRRA